jgi:hypothetical protein
MPLAHWQHLNPILILYNCRLAIKRDFALKRLRRQSLEFSGLPVFLFHCLCHGRLWLAWKTAVNNKKTMVYQNHSIEKAVMSLRHSMKARLKAFNIIGELESIFLFWLMFTNRSLNSDEYFVSFHFYFMRLQVKSFNGIHQLFHVNQEFLHIFRQFIHALK